MDGRRVLGTVLLVVGLALVVAGVAGLLGAFGGQAPMISPSASATVPSVAPATLLPTGSARPTVLPATQPPPTAAPTPDLLGIVRAFFDDVEAAVHAGSQESLVASLGGPVIDRYGVSECETTLGAREPLPEQSFEILAVFGPAPWDYTTDGLTTAVPDAYTLQARVTAPNPSGEVVTNDAELHVQIHDGGVRWFTDCGDPLP